MIVSVQTKAGMTKVNYGQISMLPDNDGTLDVPAYVAKSLVTLAGFSSSANLSPSYSALIGAGDPWEANYLFQAYGQPIPPEGEEISDAQALVTSRGAPTVSAS